MRLIGHLIDESSAKVFGDYLSGLEIGNRIESETDGTWAVWVYSEEQIDLSRQWLNRFMANPNDSCFVQGAAKAMDVRERQAREQRKYEGRMRTPSMIWRQTTFGVMTLSLIIISVLAGLASSFNFSSELLNPLRISMGDPFGMGKPFLWEIRAGQFWRLITPIFIHAGPIHLIFNILWIKDLGSLIESREGSVKLGLMVVIIAALSNVGQCLASGPFFGGMSGVVFGLFGYIWIRGKCDPRSGFAMDPTTVSLMIAWFFICFFGLVGPRIANTAHGVGLVAGMAWGWISSKF